MKIDKREIESLIVCPICKSVLADSKGLLVCQKNNKHTYPKVGEIPILINNETSVFTQEDFINNKNTFFTQDKMSSLEKFLSKLVPQITSNVSYKKNYKDFIENVLRKARKPKVLVIGDSDLGLGMDTLEKNEKTSLVVTDVSIGPDTQIVCDAHELPFEDEVFDGVVAQAVLEHVVDPYKCVEEINRVLKNGGVVYSSTPFMQQVHGGAYDFTRFTFLGHRRLFRNFKTIDEGISCGPGVALAWSYKYFLLSFTKNSFIRKVLKLFAHFTSFYFKYFDYLLSGRKESYDAASGFYYVGEKTSEILSDRKLVKFYKGGYDK